MFWGFVAALFGCGLGYTTSATYYSWVGSRALAARADQAALAHWQIVCVLRPLNPTGWLKLARASRRAGEFRLMQRALLVAQKLAAPSQQVERERCLALARVGAMEKVEPLLPRLLTHAAEDGREICEAFCAGYFGQLRFAEALRLLDAWQADHPQDAEPFFWRGAIFEAQSRYVDAVAAFTEGLRRDPHRFERRRQLAANWLALREYAEAANELHRCLRQAPGDEKARVLLADCYYQLGQKDQAKAALRQVLDAAPADFAAQSLLGRIHLAQGDLDSARLLLEAACAQRPHDSPTRYALAQTLKSLGDTTGAAPHYAYVAEAEPPLNHMEALLPRTLEEPRNANLRHEIGAILLRYGDPRDAERWFRAALAIDPHHAAARAALDSLQHASVYP